MYVSLDKPVVLKLIQKIFTLPMDLQMKIYEYLEFINGVYTLCGRYSLKGGSNTLLHIARHFPGFMNNEAENASTWHMYHRRRIKKRRAMTI
jgi:hypothetical protein